MGIVWGLLFIKGFNGWGLFGGLLFIKGFNGWGLFGVYCLLRDLMGGDCLEFTVY